MPAFSLDARSVWRAVELDIGPRLTSAVILGIGATLLGVVVDRLHVAQLRHRKSLLTAELRSSLTNRLAGSNLGLCIIVVAGLIDTLGEKLNRWLAEPRGSTFFVGLLPIVAYLIKKLPDWFGGTGKSAIGGLFKRFTKSIALVVGLLLYGLLAVGSTALVHHLAWDVAWSTQVSWPRLLMFAVLIWMLTLVSGKAEGIINLSSLHTLYSSRLTRAYLGAGNIERLAISEKQEDEFPARGGHVLIKAPIPVNENHERDYIQPRVYGELDLPAPIHIINVTLNETIDLRSQIVARDRKGDILSLEPGGIRIGDELTDWTRLTNDPPDPDQSYAENVSLGQWIAISGAAASSGMGRMTSLGFALAFTFANVRLGYWWWAPKICRDVPQTLGFQGWVAQHFATFVYLANEMTCRYSRGYDRKYLTDGGHHENTGAYALIRRKVPFILVSDNGADPEYQFDDLQTLVRQVRIDLGGETTILGGSDLAAFLASAVIGSILDDLLRRGPLPEMFSNPFSSPVRRPSQTVQAARTELNSAYNPAFSATTDTAGSHVYEARVLRGIWSTAPYLHNGSIQTLQDLLQPPESRQSTFAIGSAYDPEAVGLATKQLDMTETRVTTGCADIKSGNSHCGHDYGTNLTAEQKRDLLEYLKVL